MTPRHGFSGALLLIVAAQGSLAAQNVEMRAATFYETYSFDAGLVYNKLTEMTVPVGVTLGLGRRANIALSTGYASVDLKSANAQLADQKLSGLLDTELRFSFNIVPGRFVLIANGALPTGTKTVATNELSILGAISSDIIGFATPTMGSGGNVGGGFAAAVPLGKFALGIGGTYKMPLGYEPIAGQTARLQPGSELKLRTGLEGGLGRNTYLRLAGVYARSSKDRVSDTTLNGVGNRIIGYLSVNQQLGRVALLLYGFDVFRGSAQVEATAIGAALLNRGNLIAGGAQLAIPFGSTTVTPRFEFRTSSQAADSTAGAAMQKLGQSTRFGVDLRQDFSRTFGSVLQLGYVSGSVRQDQASIGFSGFRAALHAELRP